MPIASIIVPARNAAGTLRSTLDALARQETDVDFEAVVVDNGSADGTHEIASSFGPPVRAIRNLPPAGAGAARNAGVAATGARLLAFTDADCRPTPQWLARGLAGLERADLVQGAVQPDPRQPLGAFDRTVAASGEGGLYETASLFCRRTLFDELGGFEDWLGDGDHPIGEDLWFGWRAHRAGARIERRADALVHHEVFPRGPRGYAAERLRLYHFPTIAARVPELRDTLFYRRRFLNRRSAAFDAAILGLVLCRATASPLPLLAAAPYAGLAASRARRHGRAAAKVGAADVVADLVGLAALAAGSARARSLLI